MKNPCISVNVGRSLCLSLVIVAGSLLGPAAGASVLVVDDMEHGDPFGNGWFSFNGSVGGGGIGPNATDLEPHNGGSFSLETGWGGVAPGFFGGFGRSTNEDLTGFTHFNFWINPDAGQDYTLEINLQDDDNGDNAIAPPDDDEFQFNCVINAAGPCAVSGGGWQLVSIALTDFFDDPSFLFGGNGVLDPVSVANGGNGELLFVVFAVISTSGSDATFRTDNWTFTDFDPTAVSEPGTFALLALGLVGFGAARLKKRV